MARSILMVATIAPTIQAFLLPYARHLREQGWRVDACAAGATTDDELREAFDDTLELGLTRSIKHVGPLFEGAITLRRVVRGYDIVHVHTPIAAYLTRAVVRSMPRDTRPIVVYTAHGFHFHQGGSRWSNLVYRLAEQVAGRWTDRLVVINSEDYAAALRHHVVPRRRLRLMPGIGVDTDWYSRARMEESATGNAWEALGLPADKPYLVMVGELNPRKRPLDVLDAFSQMTVDSTSLVFVGSGPQEMDILDRAAELGLAPRVRLTGAISDVRPIVTGAAALVLASEREGLPRAIMEALSLEVPVITTDVRGNRDLVSEEVGFVVPLGDTRRLAAAMDSVVSDPRLQRAMGAKGRAQMVNRYDVNSLLAAHDRLYSEVLTERSARKK